MNIRNRWKVILKLHYTNNINEMFWSVWLIIRFNAVWNDFNKLKNEQRKFKSPYNFKLWIFLFNNVDFWIQGLQQFCCVYFTSFFFILVVILSNLYFFLTLYVPRKDNSIILMFIFCFLPERCVYCCNKTFMRFQVTNIYVIKCNWRKSNSSLL